MSAGVTWMLIAQLCFAFMGVAGRVSSEGTPWQEVLLVRFIAGAFAAWLIARARGVPLMIHNKKAQFGRSLFGTVAAFGTFYLLAAKQMPLGDAVTLFAVSPLLVALLSWPVLGERVSRAHAVAIVVGFIGVIVIAKPSFQSAPLLTVIGFVTAASTAIAMMWLRHMGAGERGEAIVFHFSVFGAMVTLVSALPILVWPSARGAMWLCLTGFAGGMGQLCMTKAYALDEAARVSAVTSTGIVMTRILALVAFAEAPTLMQWAGTALVLFATAAVAGIRSPTERPL
jgi:drug/metabolite transporter (DMT)-like permease